MRRKAVFIDRDGVINKKMPEGDYVKDWTEFHFLPDVPEALRNLKINGFLVIVITNQRCVAKGITTEETLSRIHESMIETIRSNGADIDAVYFCPHEIAEACVCRKPKPGMILKAVKDFRARGVEIDVGNSYMVGDSESDIHAGKAAGLKTVKLGDYSGAADMTVEGLMAFVKVVLAA